MKGFLIALMLTPFILFAQEPVGFSLPMQYAHPGATVDVPLTVQHFTDMAGIQFTLEWDANLLEYIEVVDLEPQMVSITDFNSPSNGMFIFLWYAFDPDEGLTLPMDHTIFKLRFKVLGSLGDTAWIQFVDEPTEPVAENIHATLMPLELTSGAVIVDDQSSLIMPDGNTLKMEVIPNPCREWCDVRFTVQSALQVRMHIIDLIGKVVYTAERQLDAGKQEVSLPAVQALPSGGYYLVVESGRSRAVHKFLIQK
jgi:hypothetical protein